MKLRDRGSVPELDNNDRQMGDQQAAPWPSAPALHPLPIKCQDREDYSSRAFAIPPVPLLGAAGEVGRASVAPGKVRQRRRTRRTTVRITTYNIRDGRQGGLYSVVRALPKSKVDNAVLQETKIEQAKFASRRFKGFTIRVAPTSGRNCGGVALAIRGNSLFRVKNERIVGPNVISFDLVVAENERWFVVGCYLPPSDKGGKAQRLATAALEGAPAGSIPLIVGDLNSDLDFPRDRHEEVLSATVRERGMHCACASRCFRPRRTRRTRGR